MEKCDDLRLNGDIQRGCGFVGDKQAGAIDERNGDHDALALATGELVWVVVEAALGIGERDLMQCGEDPRVEFGACDAWCVRENRFGDLATDAHHGIERGHGLLKDHREGAAAVRAHLIFAEGEEIFGFGILLAGELKAAGEVRGRRKEPEQSERGCRFAGA